MRLVTVFILLLICCAASADTLILKDGTHIEGDVKHSDNGYDVTTADGKVTHVAANSVESIQLGKAAAPAAATDRLGSLKRSVESLDDLNKIIARYNDFIKQNKGTPAAKDAKIELALWQQRLDQHMVKVGTRWVTPEVQEALVAKSGDIIKQAYDLMKANKLKEAEPVIRQALEFDPLNPLANYMLGVGQYRTEKLVPARKAFETAHAQLPSDAATLNNLAVIAWRQNQFINALGFYADAMLAMPANKEILNNVAEALFALKDDFRKHPAAQRASRLFIEQEAELERVMAQYGWYRWGSMWLDQNQLNELKRAEKEVKDKMDTMQKSFDDLVKQRRDNDTKIARDQQIKDDIERQNTYIDPKTGIAYRSNFLPQSWYDADREIQRVAADNDTIDQNISQMREAGKRLEASKPKPKYTGLQQIIGVEGAPRIGMLAPEPTTQPAPAAPALQPAAAKPNAPAVPPTSQPAPATPGQPTTNRVF